MPACRRPYRRRRWRMPFELEATFGDDYLYFYAESIDDAHSDTDMLEILRVLDLPKGSRILDAPCGHARISGAWPPPARRHGVDRTPAYINRLVRIRSSSQTRSTTAWANCVPSPSTVPSTRWCAG